MDDLLFGRAIRAERARRGLRQTDLGARARVSRTTVSRVERGILGTSSLGTIRRIAAVLEVRVELLPRSRGAGFERLADAAHARLAERAVAYLAGFDGWRVRPEVSFASFGERGVVDLVGWHEAAGCLLLVELKTRLVAIGETLATLDRRRRLGREIARAAGVDPDAVGSISTALVLTEGRSNRRHVAAHAGLIRAALPDDGRRLRAWLARPDGAILAATFLPDDHGRNARPTHGRLAGLAEAAPSPFRT